MKTVIVVSGLGDHDWRWSKYGNWDGIKMVKFETKWKSAENYSNKLKRLVKLINSKQVVSLLGTSAGGSLVINAWERSKKRVKKVVIVCGRLKRGSIKGWQGFETQTKSCPAFAESVVNCERIINKLSANDRKLMMTIRAGWGDELVPRETATIDGARNETVPCWGHGLSIGLVLTWFSKMWTDWVQEKVKGRTR